VVTIPYLIYIFTKYQSVSLNTPDELAFWGSAFLLIIPVRIVTEIIVYIIFNIINTIVTRKEESSIKDERDHLIELKAVRNSFYIFTLGILIAMTLLATTKSLSAMFIIFILSGFASELMACASKIYYYNRGV
jgi:hypothetical protein